MSPWLENICEATLTVYRSSAVSVLPSCRALAVASAQNFCKTFAISLFTSSDVGCQGFEENSHNCLIFKGEACTVFTMLFLSFDVHAQHIFRLHFAAACALPAAGDKLRACVICQRCDKRLLEGCEDSDISVVEMQMFL